MHRQIYMSIIKGLLSSCPTACIMSSSYAGNCTYSNIIIIIEASGSICKVKDETSTIYFNSCTCFVDFDFSLWCQQLRKWYRPSTLMYNSCLYELSSKSSISVLWRTDKSNLPSYTEWDTATMESHSSWLFSAWDWVHLIPWQYSECNTTDCGPNSVSILQNFNFTSDLRYSRQ